MSIQEICRKYGITNYIINDDGSIDVTYSVLLYNNNLTELPLKFNRVGGNFDCSGNKLTTLKGCPKSVGGYFICNENELTNLEYGPESVGSSYRCSNNKLTTLKGLPKTINKFFQCYNNNLTNLEGSPEVVNGSFICSNSGITSLKGCPKVIKDEFDVTDNNIKYLSEIPESVGSKTDFDFNPIYSIINKMVDYDFLKTFIRFKVIKDGKVNLKRLKYLMEIYNMSVNLDEIKKHYEII